MTIPASHCEAVLRGMSKRADKEGDWIQVVWQIHPNDVPQALWNADLRSRWQLAFVEIGDDEQPKAPEKPKERTRSQWAGIRCNDPVFQRWIQKKAGPVLSAAIVGGFVGMDVDGARIAASILRRHLAIESRKELDSNPEKAAAWDKLDAAFIEATRLPERH